MTVHTLSVLVENKPGVLARVSGLFSRRGFNIESLAVGPTENPEVSRMTIVVAVEELPLEQVTKQLNKLVNVIKIVELEQSTAVQRELLLVKVRADNTVRSQVLETVLAQRVVGEFKPHLLLSRIEFDLFPEGVQTLGDTCAEVTFCLEHAASLGDAAVREAGDDFLKELLA